MLKIADCIIHKVYHNKANERKKKSRNKTNKQKWAFQVILFNQDQKDDSPCF